MTVTHWYGPRAWPYGIYCASYSRGPWDPGLTDCYREWWLDLGDLR